MPNRLDRVVETASYQVPHNKLVKYRPRGFLGRIGVNLWATEMVTERVDVDESRIDLIEDDKLREALRDQLKLRADGANSSMFIGANPDHTFHHAFGLPTISIADDFQRLLKKATE